MRKENCSKQQIYHLKSGNCENLRLKVNSVFLGEIWTFVLTIDEKSWGFLNTTTIPPNNVINRTTKIMSFRKSICGSMIEIGSKICWILNPKSFLKYQEIYVISLYTLLYFPGKCLLWNCFFDFGQNSSFSQCLSTLPLWYIILKKIKMLKI